LSKHLSGTCQKLAIATLNQDDFRLFYQRHVRLFTGQNIRTSFGQSQKNEEI
jgi:hypothetical protein